MLSIDAPKIYAHQFEKLGLEEKVEILAESYGVDKDVAGAIICAESKNNEDAINKNRDKSGAVWSKDYGYWQLNDYYHVKAATRLGYDIINNPDDNLMYGFYLLARDGTAPWSASKTRWKAILSGNLPNYCPYIGMLAT